MNLKLSHSWRIGLAICFAFGTSGKSFADSIGTKQDITSASLTGTYIRDHSRVGGYGTGVDILQLDAGGTGRKIMLALQGQATEFAMTWDVNDASNMSWTLHIGEYPHREDATIHEQGEILLSNGGFYRKVGTMPKEISKEMLEGKTFLAVMGPKPSDKMYATFESDFKFKIWYPDGLISESGTWGFAPLHRTLFMNGAPGPGVFSTGGSAFKNVKFELIDNGRGLVIQGWRWFFKLVEISQPN